MQAEVSLQTDCKGDIVETGTIDRMIFNRPSKQIVNENNILKNLERVNPELASKERAYVWRNRLQSGTGIDIDAVKWNKTVDLQEQDNKCKVRKL